MFTLNNIEQSLKLMKTPVITEKVIGQNFSSEKIYTLINKYRTYFEGELYNLQSYIIRRQFCQHFSWAIPSKQAIKSIKSFVKKDKVLEVGAGLGLWAALMKNKGINIIATTTYNLNHTYSIKPRTWINVNIMDNIEAIRSYPEHTCLFVCWGDEVLNSSLEEFKGDKIIVIGEEAGGCTDYLEENDFGFKLVETIEIPQWSGIHDMIFFYKKDLAINTCNTNL